MQSISYKIKIRASINGVDKIPSDIAWIQGADNCLVTPCYKENDYLIVELLPDCVGNKCVEGWLIFDDTCSNCEPIHFKKCFCSLDSDCQDCEECSPEGLCVSKCKPNEYCYEDSCVECDPSKPCINGKICIDGSCVCPQGYFEKDGKCVQCDSTTTLTKCQECRNGVIIDKVCDGTCDPATGSCVDCLNGGDCASRTDGKLCCTANKECDCCPGTIWDPVYKTCISQPCKGDSDCNDPCMICTPEGCKPIQCPDGYKCVNGECIYWPCLSTSCANGADCGPECGCVEFQGIKQCVPCTYLQCNGLCEQALGCKCSENNTCVSSDKCSQVYCDNENPCQQPGCTCYNFTCVDCSNFPCTTDSGGCTSYTGCACSETGICEDDGAGCPNNGITLEKIEECATKEGCKLKVKIPKTTCKCDPIIFRTQNITQPTCNHSLASVFTQPHITPETSTPTIADSILKIVVGMFKKISNTEYNYADYKSNYNFTDNELITGTIEVIIKHQVYENGILKPDIVTAGQSTFSKNINNNKVGEFNLTNSVIRNVIDGKKTLVTVEVYAKSIAIVTANCIKYNAPTLIAKYVLDYKNEDATEKTCNAIRLYNEQQVKIVSDDKSSKFPRLTWYRTTTSDYQEYEYKYNGVYAEKGWFRKLFVKSAEGNFWVDYINKPVNDPDSTLNGELINNYNYIVKTDCSCGNTTANHQNTHFCCPDMLKDKVTFTNCNKNLLLKEFTTCLPNGTLSTSNPYNISTYSNVDFRLKIILNDGVEVDLPLTKNNTTVSGYDYIAPTGKKVAQAFVYQKYNNGLLAGQILCVADLGVVEPILPELTKVTDGCAANITSITYKIKKTTSADYIIDKVELTSPTYTSKTFTVSDDWYVLNIPKATHQNVEHKAIVKFKNGCEKEVIFTSCSVGFDATTFN